MEYCITNNGQPITFKEIDEIACKLWDINPREEYAAPKGYGLLGNTWKDVIGWAIAKQPKGLVPPQRIIGELAGIAAIGESDYTTLINSLNYYKPYIDLVYELTKQGYRFESLC